MTAPRRLLIIFGLVGCLLVTASALPAADPRIEDPRTGDGEPGPGDWETIDPESEESTDSDTPFEEDEVEHRVIEIDGTIEPGNEVEVEVDSSHYSPPLLVNGEHVTGVETGLIGPAQAEVVVPYATEMNVSVPEEGHSRTVDVPTEATIEPIGNPAPGQDLELEVTVGSTPVPDATVLLEGDAVAETDEDGRATVSLPETAGTVDLGVERDAVTGERTVDVPEPSVRFTSHLAFPGSPTTVSVSADGAPVEGATVSIQDGETADDESTTGNAEKTGEDGTTTIWLPIDDEATVRAQVGDETTTATVGNLYLRLTAVVLFVPGFAIGAIKTYLRVVAALELDSSEGEPTPGWSNPVAAFFIGLGDFLGSFRWPSFSVPSPSWPSLSLGSVRSGSGLDVGASLASVGRAFGALSSLPSVSVPSRPNSDPLFDWSFGLGRDDAGASSRDGTDEGPTADDEAPTLAPHPIEPRSPRAEVRSAWHAFVDRVDVSNAATRTPGQVARRAIAAGFPAAGVRRLLAIVRDVEYGGRDPSPDRVAAARETAAALLDQQPPEEDAHAAANESSDDERDAPPAEGSR